MHPRIPHLPFWLLFLAGFFFGMAPGYAGVDYLKNVKPLLQERC